MKKSNEPNAKLNMNMRMKVNTKVNRNENMNEYEFGQERHVECEEECEDEDEHGLKMEMRLCQFAGYRGDQIKAAVARSTKLPNISHSEM
jgi:hypothetical protein